MSQGILDFLWQERFDQLLAEREAWLNRKRLPPVTGEFVSQFVLAGYRVHDLFAGLENAFRRQYQICRRKGYYWLEKRERELWRAYEDKLAAFRDAHEFSEKPEAIDAWFRAERDAIEREKCRLEEDAMLRFCAQTRADAAKQRERMERRAARRAALRNSRWTKWAAACAEAIRRGAAVPTAPGQRRPTGAPIRRLCRSSVNPAPSPEALAEAFAAARGRGRVQEKIRCGSLLLDLEATVDSSLVRTAGGEIAGRKPGLRGWLDEHLPGLLGHYASLMQYRRLAQAFREAHGLRDPHPASLLLDEAGPRVFPQPARGRLESARKEAKETLASAAGRTMKDLRAALARREWRRTG